jgi:hypothetical protein
MPDETVDDEDWAENCRPTQGRLAGLGRARAAIIMLTVSLLMQGISIAIGCLDLLHLHEMFAFGPWAGDVQQRKDFYTFIFWVMAAVTFGTVVVFLIWLYRAYANVMNFGVKGLENSPGWAVGSFFIPLFNLGGPLVIVQELWRASDPRAQVSWKDGRASDLAAAWWACFLSGFFLFWTGGIIAVRRPNSIALITFGSMLSILSELFIIAAGILVIFLIKAIMRRQAEKLNRLVSEWPFGDSPDVTTITVRQIVEGGVPILLAARDAVDGVWQFLATGEEGVADGMVVSLLSMFGRDPTIAEVADLEPGWQATRERVGAAWKREPYKE